MGHTKHTRTHVITVITFLVVAAGVLVALFNVSGAVSLGKTHQVKAIVPQAGSLTQGTTVTMAGARIGKVTAVHRRGVGALVDIRITEGAVWPMPNDSTARLAVRTPLGENYIELTRGKSQTMLPAGGTVSPDKSTAYVDVDEILSVLQGKTRDRARDVFQGLGTALDGRADELHSTLRSTGSILQEGSDVTATLHQDRVQIGQLVKQLGDITSAIGERGESIRQLAKQGVTTFTALSQRDGALRSVLRELRPSVRELAPAAEEGRGVVRDLGSAATPLATTLSAVRKASPRISAALPEVLKTICQANPIAEYVKPYSTDVLNFATDLGQASNSYDAIGHTIRLMPILGEQSAAALPDSAKTAAFALVHEGILKKTLGNDFIPFPEPGQANKSIDPDKKGLQGPEDVKASGWKYPRITKAC